MPSIRGLLSGLIIISFLLVSVCGIGFNTTLIHYNSPDSPFYSPTVTPEEQWESALQFEEVRYRHMSAAPTLVGDGDFQSPVILSYPIYLMPFLIGTPRVTVYVTMDTGSSISWVLCKPLPYTQFEGTPKLLGYRSSSFRVLRCESEQDRCKLLFGNQFRGCTWDNDYCVYQQHYGDGSHARGFISADRFTFPGRDGDKIVDDVVFGCGNDFDARAPTEGLIGLSSGGASFVNQLSSKKFSYCLPANTKYTGHISFGEMAVLYGRPTPMLNVDKYDHYHLNLTDISVNGERLNIPEGTFNVKEDGTGGVIIDSGTVLTWLRRDAYYMLERALLRYTDLEYEYLKVDSSICFEGDEENVEDMPTVTFHFVNLDVVLKPEFTFVTGRKPNCICFVIVPASGSMSVFGSLTQRNHIVGYNLLTSELHMAPHPCHIHF